MKKIIYLLLIALAVSCGGPSRTEKAARDQHLRDSIARAEFIRDSTARAEHIADSLARDEARRTVIERCRPLFNETKDEFSDKVFFEPKNAPKYRNRNGVYCYFVCIGDKPAALRFVFQYHNDSWLFIRNLQFNCDGTNFTVTPDMDTDCGNGGMIWEWCDELVRASGTAISEPYIALIANSQSVKVRMNGSQYYDTRTLTREQIQGIKDAYDYYLALGGEF